MGVFKRAWEGAFTPYDPDSLNLFGKVTMWIVCLSVFPIIVIVELGDKKKEVDDVREDS